MSTLDRYIDDEKRLGIARPSKAADTLVHLYAVDVTGLDRGEALGDGSEGEARAYCDWVTLARALSADDPLLPTMLARYWRVSDVDA